MEYDANYEKLKGSTISTNPVNLIDLGGFINIFFNTNI